jgi:hypothetical protein
VTRGAPLAPSNHSSKATLFTILAPSLRSTRRLAPQCEAHELARESFGGDKADVAAWAGDLEHHPGYSKVRRGADKRHHQGRYLNTSLRTKMPMPMSKSSTTMRIMISIMTRKKPQVMPRAKVCV